MTNLTSIPCFSWESSKRSLDAAGDAAAGGAAAGGAADFGDCDPTIVFEGGLGGRPADEFTFQSADATIAADQQEALNPGESAP